MITEFSLENFKAFAAMQSIPIKPITLIYGANSSGKSSIAQAFLTLKQTFDEKRDGSNTLLSSGSLVDLGSFREFVNSHDQSKHVAVKLRFRAHEDSRSIRTRIENFIEDTGIFSSDGFEEILNFSDPVEIGVKIFVENYQRASIVSKLEIYFMSDFPLLTYKVEDSKEKTFMFLETINERHHFFQDNWEQNQEKLEGLVYKQIYEALRALGYSITVRTRNEVSNRIRSFLDDKNEEIVKINNQKAELEEIEDKEEKEVEALKSRKQIIMKEISKLEKQIKNLEPIASIDTTSACNEDDKEKVSSEYKKIQIRKENLNEEILRLNEQLSPKELRLTETRAGQIPPDNLDKLEFELEELNSLLDFYDATAEINFSKYLSLLKGVFNDACNLRLANLSPLFQPNPKRTRKNTLLAEVFEKLNASISLLEIITSICFEELEDALTNTNYLGPLREAPKRYYEARQSTGRDLDKHGSFAIEKLYNDQSGDSSLTKLVNEYFKKLGLKYTIRVKTIENNDSQNLDMQSLYTVRLIEEISGCDVNIANVGFGISQVLPVIIQSIASRSSLIVIEQPELHIHPKLQTELGQLFADCIKPPFNNFFVIETHSEHVLTRLKKLIRNGDLSKEDVSVIFVEKDSQSSKCLSLRISQKGHLLDRFPQGFFDEDYKELL